ncbi:hypothetical protein LCM20_18050 [Halobacillus litoralis]|uniref:YczE/YyaS/YitT family protein n=1 Tax=Halobacillus litoralis TaxID=45668 RepID=UPI001CD210DA|nr:hypothetical protein [Halobacillus litoralis]MCA0972503.1 hypothetical protein [Halobacillus litoralis]
MKRIFIYISGIAITYLGTSIVVKSALGAGFWSALFVGLHNQTGLPSGLWFGLAQCIIVFINAFLNKSSIEYTAIIPILIESAFFTLWLDYALRHVHLESAPIAVKGTAFIVGLIIATLGVALYIQTKLTRSPVDELFLAVSARFQWRISTSQISVAVIVTLLACWAGGPVGLGTLLAMLLMGPFVEFWNDRFKKIAI